jgi:transglutaminase-like putative cysteine protease
MRDPNGNLLARLLFTEPVCEETIHVQLTARLTPVNPFDFVLEPSAASWPIEYSSADRLELLAYFAQASSDTLLQFVSCDDFCGRPTVELLMGLTTRVKNAIAYEPRAGGGTQEPEQTLSMRSGSCRDSAWLLVGLLRALGVAARFVSGYLIQLNDGHPISPGGGSELHAWAEAYIPGAGWLGLDPTLGVACTEGHLPLACSAHYDAAAPITGSFSGTHEEMTHQIRLAVETEATRGAGRYQQASETGPDH